MSEINMDMNAVLMSMFSANSGIGIGDQSPIDTLSADGKQFVDVLDLVGDLDVADEQGGQALEFVNEQSDFQKTTQKDGWNSLALELGAGNQVQALMQQALIKNEMPTEKVKTNEASSFLTVGQNKELTAALPGTVESIALQMEAAEALSQKKLTLQEKPSKEAVATWALALARGEIKSVQVQAPTDVSPLAQSKVAAVSTSELPESVFPKLSEIVSENSKTETTKESALKLVSTSSVAEISQSSQSSAEGNASSNQEKPKNGEARKPLAIEKAKVSEVEKSISGAEFLLARQNQASEVRGNSDTVATFQQIEKPQSSLMNAVVLGQNQDTRVSAESVKFVAEKVEALKSQGGGNLKVLLNPNQLGHVEVSVSYNAAGSVDVSIKAEKPDTLKSFEGAKAVLQEKLVGLGNFNKLELSSMKETKLTSEKRDVGMASMGSSVDLLDFRASKMESLRTEISKSEKASHLSLVDNMASADNSEIKLEKSGDSLMDFSSFSNKNSSEKFFAEQGNGGEQRDRAMTAWEEEIRKKNIA